MNLTTTRRRLHVAVLAAAVGVLSACSDDRASILEPFGSPSVNFTLAATGPTLPTGTIAKSGTGATAQYTITLSRLEELTGNNVYQVWLGKRNAETGAVTEWRPATGSVAVTVPDGEDEGTARDTLESQTPGSFFSRGGPGATAVVRVTATSLEAAPFDYNFVLVSVEDGTAATTPGTFSRPLWGAPATGATGSTNMSFGYFDEAAPYVYVPAGRGLASARDGILISNDSGLTRPPRGYYYAAFLIFTDTTEGVLLSDSTIAMGDLMLPTRDGSLRDADVEAIPGVVLESPPTIAAAYSRFDASTIDRLVNRPKPFINFTEFLVVLKQKRADDETLPSVVILRGNVPATLATPPAPPED
jgi:hypothetical protein